MMVLVWEVLDGSGWKLFLTFTTGMSFVRRGVGKLCALTTQRNVR